MTIRARLYMKADCHLCEDALAELKRLRRRHPHELELVDVSAEPELLRQYGERIPVLEVAGRAYDAPLSRAIFETALRSAAAECQAGER